MSARPRGLILAIEQYDPNGMLPEKLEGTAATARAFRDWLLQTKRVAPGDIVECISDTHPAPLTTKREIVTKLDDMQIRWQNQVRELYVYVSGHGVLQEQATQPMDYLLTSEFARFRTDGNAAIALQEMQHKLRESLGPGEHYYFVDFCRTNAPTEQVELSSLGLALNRSNLGRASYYTLFSVRAGAAADVQSGFGAALVEGLKGKGRAKEWVEDEGLFVTFDALLKFVKTRLAAQPIDTDRKGMGEGRILRIDPVLPSLCTIEVIESAPTDEFELTIADERRRTLRTERFTGPTYRIQLEPDDYQIEVTSEGRPLRRIEPPPDAPADLYEPLVVRFGKTPVPHSAPEAPGPATVGAGLDFTPGADKTGSAVTYSMPQGAAERPKHRDIFGWTGKAVSPATTAAADWGVQLDLAPAVASQDLSLWLTLLGASRIIRDRRALPKLRGLPLATFDDVPPHGSPAYVLAGFEKEVSDVHVSSSNVKPTKLASVKRLAQTLHARLDTPPGPSLLRFAMPQAKTEITLASAALPNRVTLVVLVHGKDGQWVVRQLILPLWTHRALMPPRVRASVETVESLQTVHASVEAQTMFTRERDIEEALGPQTRVWQNYLYGKWLDPVMSLIGCYELIRRGRKDQAHLEEVLRNLRRFFPGLPDTEAIARLADLPWTPPQGVPLFLDGALAMPELLEEQRGAQVLDYRAPWTLWRGPLR